MRAAQFTINEHQRNVLNRLLDGFDGKLNAPKYAKLAKCSDDTALRDIRALVDFSLLIQNPDGSRKNGYSLTESI